MRMKYSRNEVQNMGDSLNSFLSTLHATRASLSVGFEKEERRELSKYYNNDPLLSILTVTIRHNTVL